MGIKVEKLAKKRSINLWRCHFINKYKSLLTSQEGFVHQTNMPLNQFLDNL
jgi:hypothetical protein